MAEEVGAGGTQGTPEGFFGKDPYPHRLLASLLGSHSLSESLLTFWP
jgi:hypothetical protein